VIRSLKDFRQLRQRKRRLSKIRSMGWSRSGRSRFFLGRVS
jgi:hypothetical protein